LIHVAHHHFLELRRTDGAEGSIGSAICAKIATKPRNSQIFARFQRPFLAAMEKIAISVGRLRTNSSISATNDQPETGWWLRVPAYIAGIVSEATRENAAATGTKRGKNAHRNERSLDRRGANAACSTLT
jgi:hypothetical protein